MITLLGLFSCSVGVLCLCSRWLGAPDPRTTVVRSGCPACGWPPWNALPCLCPEGERGPEFRGR